MAKSQESWNKKEKEKLKLKKRKDKEERKEERKASNEGKSFDDMIAYVDENGQIVSSPPDPSKKQVFEVDDIVLGVPKLADVDPGDAIRKGTVTFFKDAKGFGFIKDDVSGDSIFVHANGLLNQIKENDKVQFEIGMGAKGPTALNVKTI
jgi:cold shock CspA family protein